MDEAERWEYRIEILSSDSEPYRTFLQEHWPQGISHGLNRLALPRISDSLPYHTPYALQPQLDAFGEQGWELVTMQPVILGRNGDVQLSEGWATEYLCTFKKRKAL